jgi:hypothetical protein
MSPVIWILSQIILTVLIVLVYRLRTHPKEWQTLVLATKRLSKWLAVILICWSLIWIGNHRTELSETYERFKCGGDTCPALTANELRWRFIKSYLHFKLTDKKQDSEAKTTDRLVLLPIALDAQRLIKEIENDTLLATLATQSLPLKNHEDIDALTPDALVQYQSLVWIPESRHRAAITNLQGIKPIQINALNLSDTKHDLYKEVARRIGRWEELRGYGQHFFVAPESWSVELACCDNRFLSKKEERSNIFLRYTIKKRCMYWLLPLKGIF